MTEPSLDNVPIIEENQENLREQAKKEHEQLSVFVKSLKPADIKNGDWFTSLLYMSVKSYAAKVDAAWFREKYAGIPVDAIVEKRIRLAQTYNAIAGGLSASVYSAAALSAIFTAGLSLPIAGVSLVTDLCMTTQIQLKLAYDLSVLYNTPINIDDPEDLIKLVHVAFGVKGSQVLQQAVQKLSPAATTFLVKKTASGATLTFLKALPVVGKFLLQRNIIKMAIPFVGIPIGAGLNFYTTGQVGKLAKQIFREEAVIKEFANQTPDLLGEHPELAIGVVLSAVSADGQFAEREVTLMKSLLEVWKDDLDKSFIKSLENTMYNSKSELIAKVAKCTPDIRQELYELACYAISVDRVIMKQEEQFIRELAQGTGISFSKDDLEHSKTRWAI
jgi:hypothetical protein